MADSGEKTEKATVKKRKDERKKGNVFTSKDIVTVASVLVMFFALRLWFPVLYEQISVLIRKSIEYSGSHDNFTIELMQNVAKDAGITIAIVAIPLLFLSVLVTIVATGAQTKFLFSQESLKPKFNRISPIEG